MRIAIVGSRDYPDLDAVAAYVNDLPEGTTVVSGGARGVDQVAVMTASLRNLPVDVYKADWDRYGKSAGYRRNIDIVANADKLVAFQHNASRGTQHSIDLAVKARIPTVVVTP